MQKIMLLSLSVAVLTACTIFEPVPAEAPYETFSLVAGDTVKTRVDKDFTKIKDVNPNSPKHLLVGEQVVTYKEPKLHTPPAKDPDLSKIKNNDDPDLKGKPLRMVTIGGSLTAGVRDGGYFNEGIMTSFPNLIARQMKLKKFEQPLFDATDYNGFGRKVLTDFNPTGGKIPKFKEASNNLAVELIDSKGEVKLKKYKGQIDNFGIPFGTYKGYQRALKEYGEEYGFAGPRVQNGDRKKFSDRFTDKIYMDEVLSQKTDLLIIEFGIQDAINLILSDVQPTSFYKFPGNNEDFFFERLKTKKISKGVIFNLPNVLELPYFTKVSFDEVLAGATNGFLYTQFSKVFIGEIFRDPKRNGTTYLMLPTSTNDSISSPKVHISLKYGMSASKPLPERNFADINKINISKRNLESFNKEIEEQAKRVSFEIVDLNSLYSKIIKGEYRSDDGIAVMQKDFFSTDGINPTALGQAVIANETIKVLNKAYKTNIELIKIADYLQLK